MDKKKTIDFGLMEGVYHYFTLVDPSPSSPVVSLFEYYVVNRSLRCTPCFEIDKKLWNAVKEEVERDFNARLKEKKLKTARFKTGGVKLDRFLGMELAVLGWAIAQGSVEDCPSIVQAWQALSDCERWWFYRKAVKNERMRKFTFLALVDDNRYDFKLIKAA